MCEKKFKIPFTIQIMAAFAYLAFVQIVKYEVENWVYNTEDTLGVSIKDLCYFILSSKQSYGLRVGFH